MVLVPSITMIQGIPVSRTSVYCRSLLFSLLGALQTRVVICPSLIQESSVWGLRSAVLNQKCTYGRVFSCTKSAEHWGSCFGGRGSQVMHHCLGKLPCHSSWWAAQKGFINSKPKALEIHDVGVKTSEIKIGLCAGMELGYLFLQSGRRDVLLMGTRAEVVVLSPGPKSWGWKRPALVWAKLRVWHLLFN